jgi:hypothetical protein
MFPVTGTLLKPAQAWACATGSEFATKLALARRTLQGELPLVVMSNTHVHIISSKDEKQVLHDILARQLTHAANALHDAACIKYRYSNPGLGHNLKLENRKWWNLRPPSSLLSLVAHRATIFNLIIVCLPVRTHASTRVTVAIFKSNPRVQWSITSH